MTSASTASEGLRTYVIPFKEDIDEIQETLVRRGLQRAQQAHCTHILLDMDTPGGSTEFMIKIVELLRESKMILWAYVNPEAISAGSFIAMCCDKIFFHPNGIMGAAAVISGSGGELGETLRAKVDSYLWAKFRIFCEKFPFRYDVQRAMMDPLFVWKNEEEILKPQGELLTLTAKEAMQAHGAYPAIASGIVESLDALIQAENLLLIDVEEESPLELLYKRFAPFIPLCFLVGISLIFLEFKLSASGLLAGLGILVCVMPLGLRLLSQMGGFLHVFGLILGALGLVLLDVFIFNTLFLSMLGLGLLLGGLLLGTVHLWPQVNFFEGAVFTALKTLSLTFFGSIVVFCIAWKLGWLRWCLNQLTLFQASKTPSASQTHCIGQYAETLTPLMPMGKAKLGDKIIEVCSNNGNIATHQRVRIIGKQDFAWVVEPAPEALKDES